MEGPRHAAAHTLNLRTRREKKKTILKYWLAVTIYCHTAIVIVVYLGLEFQCTVFCYVYTHCFYIILLVLGTSAGNKYIYIHIYIMCNSMLTTVLFSIKQLSEDWQIDYESYDWRKLDSNTDETKKLVNQYFKWIGEDSKGRKFNQGKIFK